VGGAIDGTEPERGQNTTTIDDLSMDKEYAKKLKQQKGV
jgi:hypothetical protein